MARQNSSQARQGAHFPAFDRGSPGDAAPVEAAALEPFKALVKRLSEACGAAGSEEPVRELVRDEIKGFVDQVRVDALGNLIAHRRGSGSNRKKIMLAAHLDEIGVMVTYLDARGFARFGTLGEVKPLTLLGARCRFPNGAVGIIGREERDAARNEIESDTLFIDFGSGTAPGAPVQVGAAGCLLGEFQDAGDLLISKALEGRIGCAVLIETLRRLKKSPHDLYFAFTVQETVGARGAGTAAYAIQPDIAFVVQGGEAGDVPGANGGSIALGKGPAIHFKDQSLISSPSARQALISAAREARIPYQLQVAPRGSGDGSTIQAAREGVPTGGLAVPLRHLHTPSEMVHREDALRAVELLSHLISKPL